MGWLHFFLSSVFSLEERRLGENGGGESSGDLVCGGDDESRHVQEVELTALSDGRSARLFLGLWPGRWQC